MKVVRPRGFAAYGPLGTSRARLIFDAEASTREEAHSRLGAYLRKVNQEACLHVAGQLHRRYL